MRKKTFDKACYDLACMFLADIKHAAAVTDEDRSELAGEIQNTVEDFIRGLLLDQPCEHVLDTLPDPRGGHFVACRKCGDRRHID